MPFPFHKYEFIKYKDLERSPFTFHSPEYVKWSEEDDKRLLLIALDRYADALQRLYVPTKEL